MIASRVVAANSEFVRTVRCANEPDGHLDVAFQLLCYFAFIIRFGHRHDQKSILVTADWYHPVLPSNRIWNESDDIGGNVSTKKLNWC